LCLRACVPALSGSSSDWWRTVTGSFFCFFFSSRRRHTRSTRDWSSDVCSSDLAHARFFDPAWSKNLACADAPCAGTGRSRDRPRSEERRVGKECRARGAPDDEEEKGQNVSQIGGPSRRERTARHLAGAYSHMAY